MRIVVNGENRQCPEDLTVEQLLTEMRLEDGRAAVLVNDRVVSGDQRGQLMLRQDDRVEILVLACGG